MPPWIKIRADLESDPRVHTMSAHIAQTAPGYILTTQAKDLFGNVANTVTRNALRDVTIMGLSRVWFAANEHTTDGIFRHATLDYLDTLAQLPGFGEAMQLVGYVIHDPAARTLTLPNFSDWNSPNKNGERGKSTGAKRQADYRKRMKEAEGKAAQAKVSGEQTPPLKKKESDASRDVTSDVTSSISSSNSNSNSDSEIRTGSADVSSALDSGSGQPPPPADRDPLGTLKKRINDLRPCWAKASHWNAEEEHALFEARHNLAALEDQDWHLLAWFFKWANSAQNTGARTPVPVTARRHHFVSELSATLDRATTAWKQNNCPKLGDATKPAAKPRPKPAPLPEERATASSFVASLAAHGGQPPPSRPTTVADHLLNDLGIQPRPLPPPDFDSPAYKALVAAHAQQPTAAA